MNGVHANDTVNVDDAKDIGQGIFSVNDWKVCHEVCFQKKVNSCDSCYQAIGKKLMERRSK